MKERPILMSGPMIRAILEGRKTVTRRVVKSCPAGSEWVLKRPGDTFASVFWNGEQWETQNIEVNSYCLCYTCQMRRYTPPTNMGKVEWYQWESSPFHCPYGKVGDRLWVRETYLPDPPMDGTWDYYLYNDGGGRLNLEALPGRFKEPGHCVYRATWDGSELRWRPSIHMPRWASRITLEITGVRVERLQDISEADATAEGREAQNGDMRNAREWFADLWDSINTKQECGWWANPWVFVIEFKRIESETN